MRSPTPSCTSCFLFFFLIWPICFSRFSSIPLGSVVTLLMFFQFSSDTVSDFCSKGPSWLLVLYFLFCFTFLVLLICIDLVLSSSISVKFSLSFSPSDSVVSILIKFLFECFICCRTCADIIEFFNTILMFLREFIILMMLSSLFILCSPVLYSFWSLSFKGQFLIKQNFGPNLFAKYNLKLFLRLRLIYLCFFISSDWWCVSYCWFRKFNWFYSWGESFSNMPLSFVLARNSLLVASRMKLCSASGRNMKPIVIAITCETPPRSPSRSNKL